MRLLFANPAADLEILMPKPEWGVKRICTSCGVRFYDLLRNPVVCPSCGAEVDITVLAKPKRIKAGAAQKVAAKPVPIDDDDDLIEDEDDLVEDEDEDEEDVVDDIPVVIAEDEDEAEDDDEADVVVVDDDIEDFEDEVLIEEVEDDIDDVAGDDIVKL